MVDIRAAGNVVRMQPLGLGGRDNLMAWMWAILCLLSQQQTGPCAESRYNPNVPFLSHSAFVRALAHNRLTMRAWELRLEREPRQTRHQRGKKEGEAELRGFAGGCAREPLELPYGCRKCWAPPASTALWPNKQLLSSGPAEWQWAPCLPSPRSAAAAQDSEPQQGVGKGQRGLGSGTWEERWARGWSSLAEPCTPKPSLSALSKSPPPQSPPHQSQALTHHPWVQERALTALR